MALKFVNETTANVVIERLDNLLGINDAGTVNIGSIRDVYTGTEILANCVGFSTQVVERQRRAITHQAVIEAKKDGGPTV